MLNFNRTVLLEKLIVCKQWQNIHDHLYHVASLILLVAFMLPASRPANGRLLFIRCVLSIGYLLMTVWSWFINCSIDQTIWNLIYTIVNVVFAFTLIYNSNPFLRFPRDIELIYRDLFEPLKVSRCSFQRIYKCIREIQILKAEDIYCHEEETLADRLSLLIVGRLAVLKKGKRVHLIDSHQFIDSPEWFGLGCNETYHVTIMALEECRLIVWHRDKLKLTIADDLYLQAIIDSILARDVVRKLLYVNDSFVNDNHISYTNGNNGNCTTETSKLILPYHKAIDQVVRRNHLNDLTNGGSCFWSMSKINEDSETNV